MMLAILIGVVSLSLSHAGRPEIMTVQKINSTASSITVEGNLTTDTYGTISSASMTVSGDDSYDEVDCKVSTSDPKSSVCKAKDLKKCTKYKVCVSLSTGFYQEFKKCIKTSTDFIKPPKPTKLVAYDLKSNKKFLYWLKDKSGTYVSWNGPESDSSDEYYKYTYVHEKELQKDTTTHQSVMLETDKDTNVTVQFCTNCGCSDIAQTEVTKPDFVTAMAFNNQVNQWIKKDKDRANMWTTILGGAGGGFMIAMLVGAIYLAKRRQRKRNALLGSNVTTTYSKFTAEDV